jgi:hypothetical protein
MDLHGSTALKATSNLSLGAECVKPRESVGCESGLLVGARDVGSVGIQSLMWLSAGVSATAPRGPGHITAPSKGSTPFSDDDGDTIADDRSR